MTAMQTDSSQVAMRAMEAEALELSEEEYAILTEKKFDDTDDAKNIYEYYGYTGDSDLEEAAAVPEFLRRSGVKYTELVELVKTRFINPSQTALDFLEDLFANSDIDVATIYDRLEQIEAGTLIPSDDAEIMNALDARNITSGQFAAWVQENLSDFGSIITLYQPESKCDLETTYLRTLENVYKAEDTSGITIEAWSRIHRFIRLWQKLGWSIHELDLMLHSLGEDDITPQTISKLSSVVLLNKQLKRPLNQLACIWGSIDTCGPKSLYKKLFLNKAVQRIDSVFKANVWGNYLASGTELLKDHIPAILAAFE